MGFDYNKLSYTFELYDYYTSFTKRQDHLKLWLEAFKNGIFTRIFDFEVNYLDN